MRRSLTGLSLLGLLFASPGGAESSTPLLRERGLLPLGEPRTATLAPGRMDAWWLELEAGRYVEIEIEQLQVDVWATAVDSEWGRAATAYAVAEVGGSELLRWTAGAGGRWGVLIQAGSEDGEGDYRITWRLHRSPTPEDLLVLEEESLVADALEQYSDGELETARGSFERLVEIRSRLHGPNDARVVEALDRLALVQERQGEPAEAAASLERALEAMTVSAGENAPGVAELLRRRASVRESQGDFDGAEADLNRALSILEPQVDREPAALARVLNFLGLHLQARDRLVEAVGPLTRSLELRRSRIGAESFETAESHNNLGTLYRALGRYEAARSELTAALEISTSILGPEDPTVASIGSNLAAVLQDLGAYDEAEALFHRALAIREELGPGDPDLPGSLANLASLLVATSRASEARELLERALDLALEATGPSHPQVALLQSSLGSCLLELGELEEAGVHLEKALEIRRRLYGDDSLQVASVLEKLGTLRQLEGNLAGADDLYGRALRIQRARLGADHPEVARTLDSLATLRQEEQRYGEAETLFEEALEIRRRTLGDEHPEVAVVLNNLALLYETLGRYDEAEVALRRALELTSAAFGRRHAAFATALDNLAQVLEGTGRYREAAPLYEEALEIRRQIFGRSHPDVATSLNNVGLLYLHQGRSEDARPMLRRAIELKGRIYGPEHPEVGEALVNLGSLEEAEGRFDRAEPLYRRALEILEKARGPEHPSIAAALDNLASLLLAQGRLDEALLTAERVLELRLAIFGPDHPTVAESRNDLSVVRATRGEWDEARALLRQALVAWEELHGPLHPSYAAGLANLATYQLESGQREEAARLYRQALEVANSNPEALQGLAVQSLVGIAETGLRSIGDPEPPVDAGSAREAIGRAITLLESHRTLPRWRVKAYTVRAGLQRSGGRPKEAIRDLAEALRSVEELRLRVLGSEEERADFLVPYAKLFDRMVDWQLEAGDLEAAFDYAERGRARALLDQLAAAQVDLWSSIPEERRRELRERERDARARLAEYQQRLTVAEARTHYTGADLERLETLRSSLGQADRDYRQVYQELKNASSLWRDQITAGGRPVDLADAQRQLVPRAGLLLLYQLGAERSHLFVIRPSGRESTALPLEVDEEAAGLLGIPAGALTADLLRGRARTYDERGRPTPAEQLHALFQVLVPESLWSELQAARQVVVIPDGALHYFPLEALVVEPRGRDPRYWLDEGPPLRYAPSATALHNLAARRGEPLEIEDLYATVLSVSDPVFDPAELPGAEPLLEEGDPDLGELLEEETPRRSLRGGSLARLPATAKETEAILEAFGAEAKEAVQSLQRLEATEGNVRRLLEGKRYLHFGTHGIVDLGRGSLFASLVMTPPARTSRDPRDDGYLQLHEIYELDLGHVELAVLSACETNVGPAIEGEGVFALSRGFLTAGSRRVLASQWPVEDESTATLMGDFFSTLVDADLFGMRVDYTTALRDAKRKVRAQRKWSLPVFWAPFVLTGAE